MDNELIKLKEELKEIKERYKKKCERIRKSNYEIKKLIKREEERRSSTHSAWIQLNILTEMTSNLERHVYEVNFKYKSKTYIEPQVESFGSRWIKQELIYLLANKKGIVAYPWEVDILSVKKLW